MQNKYQEHNQSRRKFIQQTSVASSGLILVSPLQIFSQTNSTKTMREVFFNIVINLPEKVDGRFLWKSKSYPLKSGKSVISL